MTTTTANFEVTTSSLVYDIYAGLPFPDPVPEITMTGPVDGVWTITAPDEITKEQLDNAINQQWTSMMQVQNMQILFEKIAAGVPVNRTYLDIVSPTAEDNAAQIQALTRQVNALLILRGGDFLDISGT